MSMKLDKRKEVEEAQKTADRIAEIDKELAQTRIELERKWRKSAERKSVQFFTSSMTLSGAWVM